MNSAWKTGKVRETLEIHWNTNSSWKARKVKEIRAIFFFTNSSWEQGKSGKPWEFLGLQIRQMMYPDTI